ncbi:MraZ protein [Desulfocicer vacuolatum DSM 3385]|uniref:Transcriptional regulator MraZ n=1 Tax=Desulfocicer vacuolatum DSM 3385 TaxID=1121400 RepID=A0A1W1YI53_9BACT|nr:division/cell wall cluster transcriptional repressor MraZ [Desulfocicer vacuolatum]SMC35481.1 MraZ protein [Desulfocicer vacuolatum DSM 3385]
MFRSSSFHTMDPKGRLIIPSRFKSVIEAGGANELMITTNAGCIYAYTMKKWTEIEKKLMVVKLDYMTRFKRIFLGNATLCSCDKQDRILIPKPLRVYAGLKKKIVLVGLLDRFEIWSMEGWEMEGNKFNDDLNQPDVSKTVASLGL